MLRLTFIACVVAVTATSAGAEAWFHEDFEDAGSLEDSGWNVDDAGGWARAFSAGGPQRLVANFNSREYTTVRVYVRLHHATGTVWFSSVDIDGLEIENGGFREHDGDRIMNSDSRCLKREMTGGELLAEDIAKLNDFADSVDEDVTLMMWADALNPYHNGTWFSDENEDQLHLVPKDVVQNIWFYGPTQPLGRGRRSCEHFHRYGFTFTGSPWDDTTCCRNWGIVAGEARRWGLDCQGLLYTSWSERWAGLETLAAVAWNPPRR